mmetsp:Transcript_9959/g.21269  ORF Transcript_9959/g.21269 Transcript_9959/m.21269 type:complete len:399 (+) Transcript_9959:145-1341(+)
MGMRRGQEQRFEMGQNVVVNGAMAIIRMVTSTQVLIHYAQEQADEWVPIASGRLQTHASDEHNSSEVDFLPGMSQGNEISGVRGRANAFSDREDDECNVCGEGGKLSCCDVCPRVYHQRCLPASDAAALKRLIGGDSDWWCPHCKALSKLNFRLYDVLVRCPPEERAKRLYELMTSPTQCGNFSWDVMREAGNTLMAMLPSCRLPCLQEGPAPPVGMQPTSDFAQLSWWSSESQLPTLESVHAPPIEHVPAPTTSPSAAAPAAPRLLAKPAKSPKSANKAVKRASSSGKNEGDGGGNGTPGAVKLSAAARRTSEYRGVSKRYGRYKARIKQNGHDIVIGEYDNELEAAYAYDRKARQLHGAKALVNFPEERSCSPSSLSHNAPDLSVRHASQARGEGL